MRKSMVLDVQNTHTHTHTHTHTYTHTLLFGFEVFDSYFEKKNLIFMNLGKNFGKIWGKIRGQRWAFSSPCWRRKARLLFFAEILSRLLMYGFGTYLRQFVRGGRRRGKKSLLTPLLACQQPGSAFCFCYRPPEEVLPKTCPYKLTFSPGRQLIFFRGILPGSSSFLWLCCPRGFVFCGWN